jgi:CBS domain-containing protein
LLARRLDFIHHLVKLGGMARALLRAFQAVTAERARERNRRPTVYSKWLTDRAWLVSARSASGETTMTVRAILDTKGHNVQSVEPQAKLSAAVKMLGERRIGAVLVMSKGRIEGILSERDIVRVLGERGAGVLDEPVSAVMTRKVVSCKQTDTVAAIMEMMTLGKFRHLPVLEGDKVVGLISIGDVVKWRVREYEHEQEALRDYIKTA